MNTNLVDKARHQYIFHVRYPLFLKQPEPEFVLNYRISLLSLLFFMVFMSHNAQAQQTIEHSAAKTTNEQVSSTTTTTTTDKPAPEFEFFSSNHRQQIYEQSRLQHSTAALRSLLLPGLGNIYAEQYLFAGIAFTAVAFSAVFISFGLVSDRSDVAWAGAGLLGATYAASIGTSLYGVSQYNEQLRQGLKITAAPPPPTPYGLTLSFQF